MVHQTWRDAGDSSLQMTVNSFKSLNPEYLHLMWDDGDMHAMVRHCFPDLFNIFNNLEIVVMKADMFRYLLMLYFGGVYSDVDTVCLQPIDNWLPTNTLWPNTYTFQAGSQTIVSPNGQVQFIAGVEVDFLAREQQEPGHTLEEFGWFHPLQFSQWTIASAPQHDIIKDVVLNVTQNLMHLASLSSKSILSKPETIIRFTGPGVFSQVIHDHLRKRTQLPWYYFSRISDAVTVAGDLRILSITGFNPDLTYPDMFSAPSSDPRAFIKHYHAGRWHADLLRFANKTQRRRGQ